MPPSPVCSSLDPLQSGFEIWTPYRLGLFLEAPCTHEDGSWSHHLVEDVEDPIDGAEDPGDGVEAPMDDGESLDGLDNH